ncbi:MAG: hypothetical protein WA960_11830 [Tunicatimonas sp.]
MLFTNLNLTNKFLLATAIALVIITGPTFGQKIEYARRAKKMNEFADQWFEGEVTYKNGETILCELSYNPLVPEGLVKIMDGNRILTETVYSLESFTFYDFKATADHTYYSLQIGSRQRMFIELLHENPDYSILGRREILAKKQYHTIYLPTSPTSPSEAVTNFKGAVPKVGDSQYSSFSSEVTTIPNQNSLSGGFAMKGAYRRTRLEKNYQYYIFDMETGKLYELDRKKVIDMTNDKKKEIKQFIRANKLKFRATSDYIAVLDEYHRLTK